MSTVTDKPFATAAIPSADELVQRARDLLPMLKEKAASVEENRMVSKETIQAFVNAGFFKILQEKRWGGWELDPVVFWRVLMELGRGCPASCWNMMILGVHQWEFGHMDPRAAEDVWGSDNTTIIASSYGPTGRCEKVAGGYKLSGQWKCSSGTDHGQWAFVGGLVHDENGVAVDRIALLVPRTHYTIIDDWYVFGLCGTGSKSLEMKDVFVPEYRTHSLSAYQLNDRPSSYLYPFGTIFCGSVSAAIAGFAQGAIDTYIEQMSGRTLSANTSMKAANVNPAVRDRLGHSVAMVRSCRARLLYLMQEASEYVYRRELVPEDMRVGHVLDISRVGNECSEAVMKLFPALGARGLYSDNPMQRFLRDILAGSNHMTQNIDDSAGFTGARLLGTDLPPTAYGIKRKAPAEKR